MIKATCKSKGEIISNISIDITTPSKEIKVFVVPLDVARLQGQPIPKESMDLYHSVNGLDNLVSCVVLPAPSGNVLPVKAEFTSIENAVCARMKLLSFNTDKSWNGWTIFVFYSNIVGISTKNK